MCASQDEPKDRIPGTRPKRRINGAIVIASWGITAGWVAFETAIPPHRTEAVLWRGGIALMLTAASSILLMVWLMKRELIEPINNQQFAARMGYETGYADGYADAKHNEDARVYLMPAPRAEEKPSSSNGVH